MVVGTEVKAGSTVLKNKTSAWRDDAAPEVIRDAIDERARVSFRVCDTEIDGVAGLMHPAQVPWICDICRPSWVEQLGPLGQV